MPDGLPDWDKAHQGISVQIPGDAFAHLIAARFPKAVELVNEIDDWLRSDRGVLTPRSTSRGTQFGMGPCRPLTQTSLPARVVGPTEWRVVERSVPPLVLRMKCPKKDGIRTTEDERSV